MDAVKTNNIVGCLNILAHSTPEDINTLIEQPEGWTPMHVACMFGKTVILQLLIWVSYILISLWWSIAQEYRIAGNF